jgi:hypothetical protein
MGWDGMESNGMSGNEVKLNKTNVQKMKWKRDGQSSVEM